MTEASWDEQAQIWRVHTAETMWEAQFLVAATGPFSAPPPHPTFPGSNRFVVRCSTPRTGTTTTTFAVSG